MSNYTIKGIELHQTCGACPEQYDAYDGSKQVGYLRLRHGHFTVEVHNMSDSTLVYEAEPEGDGEFMPDEREKYLTKAVDAIILHRIKTKEDYEKLKSSGMMWEWFPDFTGVYEKDIPQEVISPPTPANWIDEEIQSTKVSISYWKETVLQWEEMRDEVADEICIPALVEARAKLRMHKTRLEYLTQNNQ